MGTSDLSMLSVRRWALAGPVILGLLAAAIAAVVWPATGEALGAVGMAVGQTVAGVLVLRRSKSLEPRERTAWVFLAIGMFLIATGVVVVVGLSELGVPVPAFGPTDGLFLGGYALLLVFLYRLARSDRGGRDWAITLLDALVGAIALSTLVWIAFGHRLVDSFAGATTLASMIAITYPILDVAVIIALMILVTRRSNFHADPRLAFIAIGISIQVAADMTFLYDGVGRDFDDAEPLYWLFLLATVAFVTVGAIVDRVPRKREFPEQDTPLFALVMPYLLVVVLLATHVVRYHNTNPNNDGVLVLDALILIGAVVFLRQMLMIHRNRTRIENQRSELVASVSHELRTPLTAMVGYLTLLDQNGDEFPEEARREMLSEATGQARHMARLVSDLVMLARGKQRHVPLQITETTVSAIVTGALRGLDTENTRIDEDLDNDVLVRVDADRVRQAIANLLSNAVRYGGEHVLITRTASGNDLVLEVHDNGPGVPTRYETAIWERFERGAHRLNATTPGLGIGLAIVQAIAEAHGGRAEYRRSSRLGGACFSLLIPDCVTRPVQAASPISTRH